MAAARAATTRHLGFKLQVGLSRKGWKPAPLVAGLCGLGLRVLGYSSWPEFSGRRRQVVGRHAAYCICCATLRRARLARFGHFRPCLRRCLRAHGSDTLPLRCWTRGRRRCPELQLSVSIPRLSWACFCSDESVFEVRGMGLEHWKAADRLEIPNRRVAGDLQSCGPHSATEHMLFETQCRALPPNPLQP